MKKILFGISLLTIAAISANAQTVTKKTVKPKAAASAVVLKTAKDSFSYAIGLNLTADLKERYVTKIDPALVKKGMEDQQSGKTPALTQQQVNLLIPEGLLNGQKEQGKAFLAANGKRAGVVTLPTGVEYEVLTRSNDVNPSPTDKDTVVANYIGTLMDGKEFDNSFKRGQPITIPVGGVIKGWTEVLKLMHVGDKWRVYIPSDMAYGDMPAGNTIPAGATLIFEIDLISVKPGK